MHPLLPQRTPPLTLATVRCYKQRLGQERVSVGSVTTSHQCPLSPRSGAERGSNWSKRSGRARNVAGTKEGLCGLQRLE